jgi:hypothetical protein
MIPLAKSEEPSGFQSRMTEVPARAMQAMSAPPAKNRAEIQPQSGLEEWMHACSLIFHTLISPFGPPDAKMLESVREKDNVLEEPRLPTRIVSACFGIRVGLSM